MKITWSHVSKMIMSSKTLMTSSATKAKSRNFKFFVFRNFSKYDDVSNFNFNIRKQHNTMHMRIKVYNSYRKQYITNGKN